MSDSSPCKATLERLVDAYVNTANQREEVFRQELLRGLFFGCLGWTEDDVFIDQSDPLITYTFSSPRRCLAVRTKLSGDYFRIPVHPNSPIQLPIATITADHPDLSNALRQLAEYCQSSGVPYAAIMTGCQLIAFVATRNDGRPPISGDALVFTSIGMMMNHVDELWNNLSKTGMQTHAMKFQLIGSLQPPLPLKLSATIPGYPRMIRKTSIQADLKVLTDLVLEDIPRYPSIERDFFNKCYVPMGVLDEYVRTSAAVIRDRYTRLTDGDSAEPTLLLAPDAPQFSANAIAESLSRRPVILIGDVGVGKTTFVRRLIFFGISQSIPKAISIYIDLGSQATLTSDLKAFVLDSFTTQLSTENSVDIDDDEFVRNVYAAELAAFSRGVFRKLRTSHPERYEEMEMTFLFDKTQQRDNHIRRSIEYLVNVLKGNIMIFLDNSDQRDYETQHEVFLMAQEMASSWPVNVYVTLRPETFYSSTKRGALSAYYPKAYAIYPPSIHKVVQKRMKFAAELQSSVAMRVLPDGAKQVLGKLEKILASIDRSSFPSSDMSEFLEAISNGNVRLALEMIGEFISGANTSEKTISDMVKYNGDYNIKTDVFMKPVIYRGDTKDYDGDRSMIGNLFDVSSVDPKEHFLRPLLLGALAAKDPGGGFVETAYIFELLQTKHGFTSDQIDFAVVACHRQRLIEAVARRSPQLGQAMPEALRATPSGVYHIRRLCRYFTYHDAVIVDTPVLEADVRDKIRDVERQEDRLDRADLFRRYLDRQWLKIGTGPLGFDWSAVSAFLKDDIDGFRRQIEGQGRPIGPAASITSSAQPRRRKRRRGG